MSCPCPIFEIDTRFFQRCLGGFSRPHSCRSPSPTRAFPWPFWTSRAAGSPTRPWSAKSPTDSLLSRWAAAKHTPHAPHAAGTPLPASDTATLSRQHPGVRMISMERGHSYIGGKLTGINLPKRVFPCATPAETRAALPSDKVSPPPHLPRPCPLSLSLSDAPWAHRRNMLHRCRPLPRHTRALLTPGQSPSVSRSITEPHPRHRRTWLPSSAVTPSTELTTSSLSGRSTPPTCNRVQSYWYTPRAGRHRRMTSTVSLGRHPSTAPAKQPSL